VSKRKPGISRRDFVGVSIGAVVIAGVGCGSSDNKQTGAGGQPGVGGNSSLLGFAAGTAGGRAAGVSRGHEQGRAAVAVATVAPVEKLSHHRRAGSGADAAQAAAQLRHAPAGRGRRPAQRAGTARSREPRHDPDSEDACHQDRTSASRERQTETSGVLHHQASQDG